ncbi:Tryptophan--tRNA ligase, mitochondrial [Xylographa opegraphella]|nr:Tryptophan--tRNA ligase, mitochondrial [Xylographa opegraphella]
MVVVDHAVRHHTLRLLPKVVGLPVQSFHFKRCGSTLSKPTTSEPLPAQVVFSGIQPTGVPHLGNYLGALQQWVQLQDQAARDTKLIFSVVDLHALTVPQNKFQLQRWTVETIASLLAVGLDHKRSTIFCQSAVPAHVEMMWILSCTASMGYLSRMTQWKSKLALKDGVLPLEQNAKEKLNLGLFSYPVLQAADVLVHGCAYPTVYFQAIRSFLERATHVPVGEDQVQHLEFTRACVNDFNSVHGNILVQPTTLLSPAKRVMSLRDPLQKMSKSNKDPRSKILLTDSPEEIHLKIKHALTDSISGISFDIAARPGVSNLLEILSHVDPDRRSPQLWAGECRNLKMRVFKELVSDKVSSSLSGFRERYTSLMEGQNHSHLKDVAQHGANEARDNSARVLAKVRDAIGI